MPWINWYISLKMNPPNVETCSGLIYYFHKVVFLKGFNPFFFLLILQNKGLRKLKTTFRWDILVVFNNIYMYILYCIIQYIYIYIYIYIYSVKGNLYPVARNAWRAELEGVAGYIWPSGSILGSPGSQAYVITFIWLLSQYLLFIALKTTASTASNFNTFYFNAVLVAICCVYVPWTLHNGWNKILRH